MDKDDFLLKTVATLYNYHYLHFYIKSVIICKYIPHKYMSKTILIADDDAMIMQIFSLGMEQNASDIRIHSATTGESTILAIQSVKPDVLVLDIRMPQGDGFSVLEYLKKEKINMPVVVLTNYRNDDYVTKCRAYGVKDYLIKHEMKIDRIVERVNACFA